MKKRMTQLQAFQQRIRVHYTVCHSKGQPHRGCSVCESVRAPSVACRDWAMKQSIGKALGDIPFTEHYKRRAKPLPGKVRKGVETDFTGLPMNPFDSNNWVK